MTITFYDENFDSPVTFGGADVWDLLFGSDNEGPPWDEGHGIRAEDFLGYVLTALAFAPDDESRSQLLQLHALAETCESESLFVSWQEDPQPAGGAR